MWPLDPYINLIHYSTLSDVESCDIKTISSFFNMTPEEFQTINTINLRQKLDNFYKNKMYEIESRKTTFSYYYNLLYKFLTGRKLQT